MKDIFGSGPVLDVLAEQTIKRDRRKVRQQEGERIAQSITVCILKNYSLTGGQMQTLTHLTQTYNYYHQGSEFLEWVRLNARDERREPPPHISISFDSLPLCHSCNSGSNFYEVPQWQILTKLSILEKVACSSGDTSLKFTLLTEHQTAPSKLRRKVRNSPSVTVLIFSDSSTCTGG
jgi:hypothetical protein